jgi:hypothetical protein
MNNKRKMKKEKKRCYAAKNRGRRKKENDGRVN